MEDHGKRNDYPGDEQCRAGSEARKYAQSTSGRSPSQRTTPADSRSMFMASDSPAGLYPYAIFFRCPAVVPQRAAKESFSSGDKGCRNSSSFMSLLHHTVNLNATPNCEFTEWWKTINNGAMGIKVKAEIRRENLRRLAAMPGWSKARIAGLLGGDSSLSYISDLMSDRRMSDGKPKSFGEKAADKIEAAVGLKAGELSIEGSKLEMIVAEPPPIDLSSLSARERAKVAQFIKSLRTEKV